MYSFLRVLSLSYVNRIAYGAYDCKPLITHNDNIGLEAADFARSLTISSALGSLTIHHYPSASHMIHRMCNHRPSISVQGSFHQ